MTNNNNGPYISDFKCFEDQVYIAVVLEELGKLFTPTFEEMKEWLEEVYDKKVKKKDPDTE